MWIDLKSEFPKGGRADKGSEVMNLPESMRRHIRDVAIFANIPDRDLETVIANGQLSHHKTNEVVFGRGDLADSIYLVISGAIQISTMSPSGKRFVVEIFREGEIFGELGALDQQPRSADAICYGGPADLMRISDVAFRALLANSSIFVFNVLRLITARLRRTYAVLEDTSLLNLELRLAKQMLYLMKLGSSGEGRVRIHARMNQEQLADLLAATSRSIITILNKWRRDGLATFDPRRAQMTILDLERFRTMADELAEAPGRRPA